MEDGTPPDLSELDMTQGPLSHDMQLSERKPPVPGKNVKYIYLPARGFMSGKLIKKNQVIRVIDLEGHQCFDCIIWDATNFYNVSNCMHTQVLNRKWNKWRPGDAIYSKNCDTLAIISEDTTDGSHAFIGAFCNEAYFRVRLGIPGCPNCRDNFLAAMANYGFCAKDIDWGSCISFFMPFFYNEDGTIGRGETDNKPGDYIDLMAQMDIVVAISNCPNERSPVNAYNPTPLQAIIFDPDEDYQTKVNSFRE